MAGTLIAGPIEARPVKPSTLMGQIADAIKEIPVGSSRTIDVEGSNPRNVQELAFKAANRAKLKITTRKEETGIRVGRLQ